MTQAIRESVVMDRFERVRSIRETSPGACSMMSWDDALECLTGDLDYAFDVAYTERA